MRYVDMYQSFEKPEDGGSRLIQKADTQAYSPNYTHRHIHRHDNLKSQKLIAVTDK
jgi:hypothetical protein